jgi:hypothetical protein
MQKPPSGEMRPLEAFLSRPSGNRSMISSQKVEVMLMDLHEFCGMNAIYMQLGPKMKDSVKKNWAIRGKSEVFEASRSSLQN